MLYDVIIIGAGASGLLCAITAGQRGRNVLVLDSSNKVGKKILMSGGGRCNFTNLNIQPERFLSHNPHFCKSALSQYTQWDFIQLVEKHDIAYEERKHGQLFCQHSSRDILAMLVRECEPLPVTIQTHCNVETVSAVPDEDNGNTYYLNTNLGKFSAGSLVIASGGLSIPKMGATNFGYRIAKQFKLAVHPTRAGLVPFTFSDHFKQIFARLSGVSQATTLSNTRATFQENILFTHRGLSGPAALQLSSYWQEGETINVDLLMHDMTDALLDAKRQNPNMLLRNIFASYFTKTLISELETLFWPDWQHKPIADIPDRVLKTISHHLSNWQLTPSGTEGYRTAEVTLGGVDTDYLSSKTMECKHQPGLYFIGEVVDLTGHLGGYNFQWAWSSGHVAGLSV